MAEPIGALRGELSLSAAQFEQDIKAARSALRREAAGMESAMASFQSRVDYTVRSLANLSAVAVAGVGALAIMGRNAIASADAIGKMADSAGVGVEFLQELRFAAGRSGVSADELDQSMLRLSRTIGSAVRGASAAQKPFDQLGISLTDAEGRTRSTEAVFNDLAAAFSRIKDPAIQASLAQDLFGRQGARMTVLLRDGAEGVDRYREAARRLGLVLEEDLVRKAEVANDKLDDMRQVMQVKSQVMALQLMPVLERFAELMTSPQLLAGIDNIARAFADVIEFAVKYNREIIAGIVGLQVVARSGIPNPYARLAVGAGAAYLAFQGLTPESEKLQAVLADQVGEVERLEQAWRRTADPEIARGIHEQMMVAVEAAAETRRQIAALEQAVGESDRPSRRELFEPFEFGDPIKPQRADDGLAARLAREEEMRKNTLERELQAIRESLMTREELENLAQERRLESLRGGLEMGILAEQEFGELRLETEMATLERLREMRERQLEEERRVVEERVRLEQYWADQVTAAQFQVGQSFVGLMRTMGSQSRVAAIAAIALNAGLMGAQAWQSTLAAEMRALAELGPIAGPPMAAKIRAWGLANIAGIAATSLAQGLTGGSAGGGGGGGGASATAAVAAQPARAGGIAYLNLDSGRSRYTAEEVREIAERLNDLIGDGFELREIRVRS
jgi:hypothetical protein